MQIYEKRLSPYIVLKGGNAEASATEVGKAACQLALKERLDVTIEALLRL